MYPEDMRGRNRRGLVAAGVGLAAGGAIVGAILAGSLTANAATPTASASASSASGTQENDGIPESQEHHGGGLNLTGQVTAVGNGTVTIKTSTGTTTYQVDGTGDIDKNGEAQLSSLAVGDAVRYSIRTGTTTIDKLHAGDENKDRPTG